MTKPGKAESGTAGKAQNTQENNLGSIGKFCFPEKLGNRNEYL